MKLNELIEHNCPVQGPMMIEPNKPCNWCDEIDKEENSDAETYIKESSSRRHRKET